MKISNLTTNQLNQNGYNKNSKTQEKIGALYSFPIAYTPEDCLSCEGFVLKIIDYKVLYSVIGKKFNKGTESSDEFRIPDYNITGRFLQPGVNVGSQIAAGLPNITGIIGAVGLNNYVASGAFYYHSRGGILSNSGEADLNVGFDASRSSTIYGNSTSVQPPSQIVHICIKYK